MSATPPNPPDDLATLEPLVAAALEALDRGGEAALTEFLAQHQQHRSRIDSAIAGLRAAGMLGETVQPDIPAQLGEFRLLRPLGGGGMGIVFVAEQTGLERKVAIKLIRPDLLFLADAKTRFQREIAIIARLSHPSIVPIVATGEHAGTPWYAMPLLSGASVDRIVQRLSDRDPTTLRGSDLAAAVRGEAPATADSDESIFAGSYWETCVRLVRQAALGLEHAHREGVVHRDVKPSNLMITPDGRALLLDFGLASHDGDPAITRSGFAPGSPAFMAPEQVRGQPCDARSDVYSLAATLRQLLDLVPPFAAANLEALRAAILRGDLSGLRNRVVPAELRVVLGAAMELDPARRYASARQFADDLSAVLERRPIRARPLPRLVRGARWLERHRRVTVVLSGALLAILVAGPLIAWQRGQALQLLAHEKAVAESSRDRALGAIQRFLTSYASDRLRVSPGMPAAGEELLDDAITLLDQLDGKATDITFANQRARAERWKLHFLRRQGKLDDAASLAHGILSRWPDSMPRDAETDYLLATVRAELVRMALSRSRDHTGDRDVEATAATALTELDSARRHPALRESATARMVEVWMDRAEFWRMHGESARAIASMRELLSRTAPAAIGELSPRDEAFVRLRLSDALRESGDANQAHEHARAAVALLEPEVDPLLGSPLDLGLRAHAQQSLARLAIAEQDVGASREHYASAIELAERRVAAWPEDADGLADLAGMLTEAAQVERLAEAAPSTVRAMLERARRLFARIGPAIAQNDHTMAGLRIDLGLLMEHAARDRDPVRTANWARELIAESRTIPDRLAAAAWHLLLAATWHESHGGPDAPDLARACEDDALAALLACDAAGWHAPIDLSASPCRRLDDRPPFAALRAKHPTAERPARAAK
ncbi:MAG: protein kinase [Planctomycetota bacterium]